MWHYVEKYHPFVLAGVLSFLFYKYQGELKNVDKLVADMLSASLVICGTLMGFLLTITTIISAIPSRRMKFVKDSGLFPSLMGYLKIAISLNIFTVSLIIITPFLNAISAINEHKLLIHSFQVFIVSWAWIASIRFSILFVRLLADPN